MSDRIALGYSFSASTSKLWSALTDPIEMKKWFFTQMPDFKAEPGFKTSFPVQSEDRVFTHHWEVLEAKPNQRLVMVWTYEEYPGRGVLTFEFKEGNEGGEIDLSFTGIETFPRHIPEFQRESCIGGWNYFLGQELPKYLNA